MIDGMLEKRGNTPMHRPFSPSNWQPTEVKQWGSPMVSEPRFNTITPFSSINKLSILDTQIHRSFPFSINFFKDDPRGFFNLESLH